MKASSSSTDLVAGFRIERQLGDGVWEAFQPELDRRVVLRRMEPGMPFDAAAWPERAGVVALYAVVEGLSGTYVATRLVPGARTFAELTAAPAARRRRWIDEAAATLDGVVHGRLTERDILVGADGHAVVTGFGSAADGATAEDDRAVLDRLRPSQRVRAWRLGPAVAVLVIALAALLVWLTSATEPAPPVTVGAAAVGSALGGEDVASVDCEGGAPTGSSLPCTVMQAELPGRPLVAPADGIVRGWAVRGATGRLRLQVLRPVGGGRFTTFNQSPVVTIDDPGAAHLIPADLSVPKGARFALEVAPGATAGIRDEVGGASTVRFFSPLRGDQRRPDRAGGDAQELQLRVDVVPRG